MDILLRPFFLLVVMARATLLRAVGQSTAQPDRAETSRARFQLAVWLALAALPAGAQSTPLPPRPAEPPLREPVVMCYDMMPPNRMPDRPLSRVRLLWMALDPAQAPALAAALKSAVAVGEVEARVSNVLIRVHAVLAEHHHRSRVERIMCYRMSEAGARTMGRREAALAQLEALQKTRKAGKVESAVLEKASANLAETFRELGLEPPPELQDAQAAARIVTEWALRSPEALSDLIPPKDLLR